MSPATLEAARDAKEKLRAILGDMPEVCGVGIAVLDGGYGVKLNLAAMPERSLPEDVDGVPVVISVVGSVRPL